MADYAFFTMFLGLLKIVLGAFAIAGLIFLAWWIKLSFRSHRARRLLWFIPGVVVVAGGLLYGWNVIYQSPSRVVERTGAIPKLRSLQLINGRQDNGLESGRVWLRFKVSPEDLLVLLGGEQYSGGERDSTLAFKSRNYDNYNPPSWWNYKTICPYPAFYVSNHCKMGSKIGYDRCYKELIVNTRNSEVLLLMHCWYADDRNQ